MRSNLRYQINKFVNEIHNVGVYKHRNFKWNVNVDKNQFMISNKWIFVYLEKKLGANEHLFIYKQNWGQINDFG